MNRCTLGQPFSANFNPSYHGAGLLGHTGVDEGCGYGSPITAHYDGYVYKTLTEDRPANDGSGFTGVFIIVDNGLECFEWLIGHCDPQVLIGSHVTKGQQIATEANHGQVYSGNIQITLAMQQAGDMRGAHRHYQKRPVMVVDAVYGQMLFDIYGQAAIQGKFYKIFNYDNGFNGCVDPVTPVFNRLLTPLMSGYDVYVLQRFLIQRGLLTTNPTAFFGSRTFEAVQNLQRAVGLQPVGVVGPQTRAFLNQSFPLPVVSIQ